MLQIKIWAFDLHKPKGYTPEKMEKEINKFFSTHTCIEDTFEMFELLPGFMIVRILYKTRKVK